MRQFVAESPLNKKGTLVIEGKKFHYLTSVLRAAPGDMIYVRLPDGSLQNMTVAMIDQQKKQVVLQVAGDSVQSEEESFHAAPTEKASDLELWLFMFVAKPPKMELIVRQAVECGVSVLVPVEGRFCQKGNLESARRKLNGQDERIKRVITEAMEQSGSAVSLEIKEPVSLEKACDLWREQNGNGAVVLYEQTQGTKPLHQAINFDAVSGQKLKAAVAVGAEGGIAPEEIELMQNAGFVPVHFGTNILRCETAALYGIASLQTVIMEKEKWQIVE